MEFRTAEERSVDRYASIKEPFALSHSAAIKVVNKTQILRSSLSIDGFVFVINPLGDLEVQVVEGMISI